VTELSALGIACVRAANPGPYTLSGTNTWVLGRDPAWVVDPGPALEDHLDAVAAEVARRGGAGGIALTHDHADHAEGAAALRDRLGGVPLAAVREPAAPRGGVPPAAVREPAASRGEAAGFVALHDGDTFGPFRVVAVPGHADDHVAFVAGGACFTGDAVLGEGSVFVTSDLAAYLAALQRLRALDLAVLCPGHGPPVWDPRAKLDEYVSHRLDRERRLLAALDAGSRTRDELLDAAWPDAPPALRGAAALTLAAHLDKLREEGRLPGGA
jgi:glyoxylase-like metal-dependent hydrolase (beta-lactamase superfamily II)